MTRRRGQQGQTDAHSGDSGASTGQELCSSRGRKGKGTVALQPEAQIRGSHNSLSGLNHRFKSACDLILSPLQMASMKTDLIAKNYLSRLTVGKVYKYSGCDLNLTKARK